MQLGRPLVNRSFDLIFVSGGLTLPVLAWRLWGGSSAMLFIVAWAPLLMLLINQSHFAASSVRLYTRPGAFARWPFLTMVLPILTIAALTLFIVFSGQIGRHLWALALSWSPFHYAAQTFGIASIYCYRSGCALNQTERRLLRVACLMPFFRSLLGGASSGYGIGMIVPPAWIEATPEAVALLRGGIALFDVLTFAMPALLVFVVARRSRELASLDPTGGPRRPGVPLLSLFTILASGVWFVFFDYLGAFVWATVFHGLQYLGIVATFHARERAGAPEARHGALYHTALLYVVCLALGYALFQCWPRAYELAGFGMVETTFLVIAMINIHHFIVDAFIWRIRKDPNYKTVIAESTA